jgi:hypothetical protein
MPFVFASVVFMSIGSALLSQFTVDIATSRWIGYQIIFGLGSGFGFQQSAIAAQACLDIKDVPIGTACLLFVQILGGAIFVSVGQNTFTNKLIAELVALDIPQLDPAAIVQIGATQLRTVVDAKLLPAVLLGYNAAVAKTFQVALIMSCLSVLGAAGMEWKSIKRKRPGPTVA